MRTEPHYCAQCRSTTAHDPDTKVCLRCNAAPSASVAMKTYPSTPSYERGQRPRLGIQNSQPRPPMESMFEAKLDIRLDSLIREFDIEGKKKHTKAAAHKHGVDTDYQQLEIDSKFSHLKDEKSI